jgi:regulator of sigma E protease
VRRELDAVDYGAARAAYAELEAQVAAATLSKSARRAAFRGLRDVEEGTDPEAYWRAPTWKRISVIAAGPAANVLAAFLILFAVYGLSGASSSSPARLVGVEAKKPAAAAGLRAADVITSMNGRRADAGNISGLIQSTGGRPATVVVTRHGHVLTIRHLTPIRLDGRWILGIELTPIRYPVSRAATTAGSDVWHITTGTVTGLASLVHSHSGAQVTTGIGIARYSAAALRVSVAWYFQVLAFVSMSLALLNLIPILPLDGGHILFSLIESVRRRAVAREVYERASLIGLTLILVIFIIAFASNPTGNVPH